RGRAVQSSRSMNSHMREYRSVTCAPIVMPSRSLNCAMDLRSLVTWGFWPVIAARSRMAPSMTLESRAASPTPMFTTTLVRPGTSMTFWYPNCSVSCALMVSLYLLFRRGVGAWVAVSLISDVLPGALREADAHLLGAAVLELDGLDAVADLGRLVVLRVDQGHVRDVDRGLALLDAARCAGLVGPDVVGAAVDALDQHALGIGEHLQDATLLALVAGLEAARGGLVAVAGATGDHLDEVALLDLHLCHVTPPPVPARRSS